jgi:hypothetical protein
MRRDGAPIRKGSPSVIRDTDRVPPNASGLHEYYIQQGVLPTFAALDEAGFDEYARKRAVLMRMLQLPLRVFDNADVVEFGPDSGENSIVFARWGANLTLVEPNPNSWPKIDAYFRRFGLESRLHAREQVSIQDFVPRDGRRFDVVDAEGFIYTVRPESIWLDLFGRILVPGGLALLSYQERTGSFFEFLMKVVHAQHRRLTGLPAVESAAAVFTRKWDSLPHTRRFESWVMDVLENPYVRRAFAFDADELYCRVAAAGLPVYSSWPVYTDALKVHWHKQEIPAAQRQASDRQHIARSRLSFVFGSRAYLTTTFETELAETVGHVHAAIESIDRLIDRFDADVVARASTALAALRRVLASGAVLIDRVPDRPAPAEALRSAEAALAVCATGDAAAIAGFCNADPGFIGAWGQPAHLVVLQRDAE